MTLVLQWVPQVASAAVAPAAVVGPPGIREAAQARADGLIPADTPDDQLSAVYAAYLGAVAVDGAADQIEQLAGVAGASAGQAAGADAGASAGGAAGASAGAASGAIAAEVAARNSAISEAVEGEAQARTSAIAPVAEKANAALPAAGLNAALASLALGGGTLVAGQWKSFGRMPRLRLTGTGTVTIDARNRLGAITVGVASYTVTDATNQIEFPYFGDDAVEIRAAFTGTAAAEII